MKKTFTEISDLAKKGANLIVDTTVVGEENLVSLAEIAKSTGGHITFSNNTSISATLLEAVVIKGQQNVTIDLRG